jgi:DNA-binding SARP family transcriptional activator
VNGSPRRGRDRVVGWRHRLDSPLWLRLIGPLTLWRAGEPLDQSAVGHRKARTLLALLAVERRTVVSVEMAVNALWDGAWPRDPAANVATLVSRLRATLGAGVVRGGRGGYRLGDAVGTDLDDAARLVEVARAGLAAGNPDSSAWPVEQALTLLEAGPLLSDFPEERWMHPARLRHAAMLRDARLTAAAAALANGALHDAHQAAQAAWVADALDEPAACALMRIHVAAGEPAKALTTFAELRATLAEELGVEPSKAASDLHVAILRGRAADPPGGRPMFAADRT